jgi:hypothetical protein
MKLMEEIEMLVNEINENFTSEPFYLNREKGIYQLVTDNHEETKIHVAERDAWIFDNKLRAFIAGVNAVKTLP